MSNLGKLSISINEFCAARKGAKMITENNRQWTFVDDPIPVPNGGNPMATRFVENPSGDEEELTYFIHDGENNIVDEDFGLILELNTSDTRLE